MKFIFKSPKQAFSRAYQRQKLHPIQEWQPFIKTFDDFLYEVNRSKEKATQEQDFENQVSQLFATLFTSYPQASKIYATELRASVRIHAKTTHPPAVLVIGTSPTDKKAMITPNRLNRQAFYQTILCFLWETIILENRMLQHIIVTNIERWFIFDVTSWYVIFSKDKDLVQQFYNWEKTKNLPKFISFFKKWNTKSTATIIGIFFELVLYEKAFLALDSPTTREQERAKITLSHLYKVLSPNYLFRQNIPTDNPSFHQPFYEELLYILGLEEQKKRRKKKIQRATTPQAGSFIENIIHFITTNHLLHNLRHVETYGATTEEQLFNIAYELLLTWLSRILFLKQLEGQLVSYHIEDEDKGQYRFLHPDKIQSFEDLETLFFEVVSVPHRQRSPNIFRQYQRISFLNCALFEVTSLERHTLRIANLKNNTLLDKYEQSILTTSSPLPLLQYLLKFLDAYDFGIAKTTSIISPNTPPKINNTTLRSVFERLIQQQAFFTPSTLGAEMVRPMLRKIVCKKFNHAFDIKLNNFEELKTFCSHLPKTAISKAQQIIQTIRICDPAVGVGQLLLTALHELLVIKSELRLLVDVSGERLTHIELVIANGALLLQDTQGNPFQYQLSFANGFRKLSPSLQQIQEAIFHEKKYLIEHCLFGLDNNPLAVKMCQVQLWFELLQHVYYRRRNNTQLETLPNIDLNIKCGDALISRFGLEDDLDEVFKRSEYSVQEYKANVKAYKTTESLSEKANLTRYLDSIKDEFIATIDKKAKTKIAKARGALQNLHHQLNNNTLFGFQPTAAEQQDLNRLQQRLEKLEAERDEILSHNVYRTAFEWRFEFPEVLDEEGNFAGFDLILSQPPAVSSKAFRPLKPYLKNHFTFYQNSAYLHVYFIERGLQIVDRQGITIFLIPQKFKTSSYGKAVLELLRPHYKFNIKDLDEDKYPQLQQYGLMVIYSKQPA